MGQHRPGAMTVVELAALLSRPGKARTVGAMRWRQLRGRSQEGIIDVETAIPSVRDGRLYLRYTEDRPWAPVLSYLTNDVPVRRACINAQHNGWDFGTHLHTYLPASGGESCEESDAFTTLPMRPAVTVAALRTVFHEFAGACSITVDRACWTDPMIGR